MLLATIELDDLVFLSTQSTKKYKQRERLFLKNKFKKLLSLLNVYASLHLANITHKYNTIINLNILIREIKYM